jgi:hypothetical protein
VPPCFLIANEQPIDQVCNGLFSVFGNWKIKKLRRFVDTVANAGKTVFAQFTKVRSIHFIAAFTSEKRWMTIEKSLFRN